MKQITRIQHFVIRDGEYVPVKVFGRGSWPHDGQYYVVAQDGAWADYVSAICDDRELAVESIANQVEIDGLNFPHFVHLCGVWALCSSAMTNVLKDDAERVPEWALRKLADSAVGMLTRYLAQAELDRREEVEADAYICGNCGGDVREGQHNILAPGAYNEPPDYWCAADDDRDDEVPY